MLPINIKIGNSDSILVDCINIIAESNCPILCDIPPKILIVVYDSLVFLYSNIMIVKESNPPQREFIIAVNPLKPENNPFNMVSIYEVLISLLNREYIIVKLPNPILAPSGNGIGIVLSIVDSATVKADRTPMYAIFLVGIIIVDC